MHIVSTVLYNDKMYYTIKAKVSKMCVHLNWSSAYRRWHVFIAGTGGHYIGDHLPVIMVLSRDHLSSYLMLHLLITYNASSILCVNCGLIVFTCFSGFCIHVCCQFGL